MRFLMRSLIGLALILGAVGVTAYGGWRMSEVMGSRGGSGPERGGPRERVFAVQLAEISLGTVTPRIAAFGEIEAWRELELRAEAGGRIVRLSENFRDGAEVAEGELLFALDRDDAETRVSDAEVALDEARADLSEAEQKIGVAAQELAASETQLELRRKALERRRGLRERGVSTAAEVEDAEMQTAAAEQALASRAQMRLNADVAVDRTRLRVRRAELALEEARRALAETEFHAPFGGLLTNVTATLGGLVSQNERLGLLIDPAALEVAFRVTNAQYARLIDDAGALKPVDVSASLELDRDPLRIPGRIERAGAAIGDGETGRLIYAKLDLGAVSLLRPGDFVAVEIVEPELTGVALLPAAAVTEAGELLVVGEDERLRAVTVDILRRQGDTVIAAGAPAGARYVTERAPQLGPGIKVKAIGGDPAAAEGPGDMVELDPERQKRLIDLVEASERMPADMKMRVLTALRSGRAPAQMVEQIEARLGNSG